MRARPLSWASLEQPPWPKESERHRSPSVAAAFRRASASDTLEVGKHTLVAAGNPADTQEAGRSLEAAHNPEDIRSQEAVADSPVDTLGGNPAQDTLGVDNPVVAGNLVADIPVDSLEGAVARRKEGEVLGYRLGVGYHSWLKDRIRPD